MRRVPADGADGRAHPNALAEDLHLLRAVGNLPPEGPHRLVAHREERALRVREVGVLMPRDAAAHAHTRAGDDDLRPAHVVDCARLLRSPREPQVREVEHVVAPADFRVHALVHVLEVLLVNRGHPDGERRVEEDGDVGHLPALDEAVQFVEEHLRPLDGECRDEERTAAVHRLCDDGLERGDARGGRLVVPVPVHALHDEVRRVGHRLRIVKERRRRVPEVAGEDNLLPAARELDD